MISRRSKYGLKAMLYLANRDHAEYIRIEEIAHTENIPKRFLEHILVELKRNDLLVSKKGAHGGYRLAQPPGKISIGDVIRILDGLMEPEDCMKKKNATVCDDCKNIGQCTVRNVLTKLFTATEFMLNNTTLENAGMKNLNLALKI